MSIEINGVVFQDENAPEALKAKIALVESEKAGLVAEITGDRKKNRDAVDAKEASIVALQQALKEATEKNTATPEDAKIASVVAAELSKIEKAKAIDSRKVAFDKFVNEHKEFHPDNDPSGLKRAALEKELNGLTAWVTPSATEDFAAVIGKANALLQGIDTTRQTNMNHSSSLPPTHSSPKDNPEDKLTSKEKVLVERNGWTEEKYLGLKTKMPEFIEGLLEGMRS